MNFINFETDRIDDCVEFMKQLKIKQQKLNGSRPGELCVMATGGGAYKFYDKIREVLGVDVLREDEMECLIIGEFKVLSVLPCKRKANTVAQGSISLSPKSLEKCSHIVKQTQCSLQNLALTYIRIYW